MATQDPAAPAETVRQVLADRGELGYAFDPTPAVLDPLVEAFDGTASDSPARLLLRTEQLKAQVEDFLFASRLADLAARDAVAFRTDDAFANRNLLVFESTVVQIFDIDGQLAAIETTAEPVLSTLETTLDDRWAAGSEFQLRTPARSAVEETIEQELGTDARADFTAVIDSLETARGNDSSLDEVTVALLVAARNEALLYDVSKWGEDVGLASKATFSRTKSHLEDLGIIATEKVPIDVGRPRLRLKFADERLQSASADELASVAIGLLE
jgi:hypothetical protein